MVIKSNVSMEKKSFTYVLAVFFATTAAIFLLYTFFITGLPTWFVVVTCIAYFAFTLYNAEAVMGLRNALVLKVIAAIITFSGEAIGVNFGWVFGSYFYTGALGIKLLGVPLIVILVWDIYIYTSYMIVSHIVNIRFTEKLFVCKKFLFSALIALLTALATTAADLIIDPVAVVSDLWVWRGGGNYFPGIAGGVPISNFVGWLVLSFLSIFIFKFFFERPFVEKETLYEHAATIPYIATFLVMFFLALNLNLPGPAFVGGFAMSIVILFYVLAVLQRRFKLFSLEN